METLSQYIPAIVCNVWVLVCGFQCMCVCVCMCTVDEIYQAITHCQTLYPDPDQSDSDEQGPEEGEGDEEDDSVNLEDGDFLTTAEGLNHLSPEGFATLSHLERILQLPTPAEFEATVSNGELNHYHTHTHSHVLYGVCVQWAIVCCSTLYMFGLHWWLFTQGPLYVHRDH